MLARAGRHSQMGHAQAALLALMMRPGRWWGNEGGAGDQACFVARLSADGVQLVLPPKVPGTAAGLTCMAQALHVVVALLLGLRNSSPLP